MIEEILTIEDEWTDSAENEDAERERIESMVNKALSDWIKNGNPDAPIDWPEEPGDDQCLSIFEQVEQAPLCKPRGKCVLEKAADGVLWKV